MFFFFQAEDGIRDVAVTGVQTCALPISQISAAPWRRPLQRVVGRLLRGWTWRGFYHRFLPGKEFLRPGARAPRGYRAMSPAWREWERSGSKNSCAIRVAL